MATNQITKIYELKSLGTDQLLKDLGAVNKSFDSIRKSALDTKAALANASGNPAEVAKLTAELKKLEIQEANVSRQSKELQADLAATNAMTEEQAKNAGLVKMSYNELDGTMRTAIEARKELSAAIQAGHAVEQQTAETILSEAQAMAALDAERQEIAASVRTAAEAQEFYNAAVQEGADVTAQQEERFIAVSERLLLLRTELKSSTDSLKLLQNQLDEGAISAEEFAQQGAPILEQQKKLEVQIAQTTAELKIQTEQELAGVGSIDEMRAKLAELTKERNSVNQTTAQGTVRVRELNAEIDKQNALIKASVDAYQKQKINIGNYPTLKAELAAVTAEMQHLALAGEKNTVVFKELAARAAQLSVAQVEVAAATKAAAAASAESATGIGTISTAATKAFGAVRQLAYILPGLGMAGIFSLLFEGLEKAISLFTGLDTATKEATEANKKYEESLKNIRETERSQTNESIAHLNVLALAAKNTNLTLAERTAAVLELQKTYPEYFANLTQEEILNGRVTESINGTVAALIKKQNLQINEKEFAAATQRVNDLIAAGVVAQGKYDKALAAYNASITTAASNTLLAIDPTATAAQKLQEASDVLDDVNTKLTKAKAEQDRFARNLSQTGTGGQQGAPLGSVAELRERITALRAVIDLQKAGSDEQKKSTAELIQLEKQLRQIEGKTTGDGGSHISGAVRDELKDIIALQNQEEATLKTQFLNGEVSYRDYVTKLQAIEDDYAQKKIARLKGTNASERLERSKILNDNLEKQKATNAQLLKIDLDAAQARKDVADRAAKEEAERVQEDPNASAIEKDEANQTLYQKLLANQTAFNTEADSLEKQYNEISVKNAQDRAGKITDINKNLGKTTLQLQKDLIDDALKQLNGTYDTTAIKIRQKYDEVSKNILNSQLSASEKKRRLEKLNDSEDLQQLDNQISRDNAELAAYRRLYESKVITQEEFNQKNKELLDKRDKDQQAYDKKSLDRALEQERLMKEIYSASINILQAFAQAENERQNQAIESKYDEAKSFRDAEKDKRLAQAQSAEERDAIQKQYDQKDKEAEKQRNKEHQDQTKKEMAIELGLATMKILAGEGTWAEKAVKEAELLGLYFAQLQLVNAQKFAKGGKALGPGLITGAANIPIQTNGDNVLATVKTGEVILNEVQQRMAGGPAFFRALGVPGFATGGYLGSQVQPPVFASQIMRQSSGSDFGQQFDTLHVMISKLYATVAELTTESYKPVVLNPNAVTNAQGRNSKAVKVGVL